VCTARATLCTRVHMHVLHPLIPTSPHPNTSPALPYNLSSIRGARMTQRGKGWWAGPTKVMEVWRVGADGSWCTTVPHWPFGCCFDFRVACSLSFLGRLPDGCASLLSYCSRFSAPVLFYTRFRNGSLSHSTLLQRLLLASARRGDHAVPSTALRSSSLHTPFPDRHNTAQYGNTAQYVTMCHHAIACAGCGGGG
jgi:hypothetical protein